MKFTTLCILILCLLSAVTNHAQKALQQSYEVYESDLGYIVRGAIDLEKLFSSSKAEVAIQWALDHQGNYGEVKVNVGQYPIGNAILMPSNITLSGTGPGTQLIIDSNSDSCNGIEIINKDRSIIKNLVIKSVKRNNSSKTGILLDNSGGCTIQGVTIVGMNEDGIHLTNNTFLSKVTDCTIAESKRAGIGLSNLSAGGRGGDFVMNDIESSMIVAGGYGVYCDKSLVTNIRNIGVYQSKKTAFYMTNGSNSNLISNCRTFQVQSDAVVIKESHEINISGNIFCWTEGNGLVLDGVLWGAVSGNDIIDSGSINLFDPKVDSLLVKGKRPFVKKPRSENDIKSIKSGIVMVNGTKGLSVSGNAIFNWPVVPKMKYGIFEDATCSYNTIVSNNINFATTALESSGEGSVADLNVNYDKASFYNEGSTFDKLQYFDTRLIKFYIDELWE